MGQLGHWFHYITMFHRFYRLSEQGCCFSCCQHHKADWITWVQSLFPQLAHDGGFTNAWLERLCMGNAFHNRLFRSHFDMHLQPFWVEGVLFSKRNRGGDSSAVPSLLRVCSRYKPVCHSFAAFFLAEGFVVFQAKTNYGGNKLAVPRLLRACGGYKLVFLSSASEGVASFKAGTESGRNNPAVPKCTDSVHHVQASLPFICPLHKKVAELLFSKWKQIVVVTAQQFQVC